MVKHMKELNRQVVIFGDFNSIGFEIKPELSAIMKRLNLSMDAAPDFIQPQNIPIEQMNNIVPPIMSVPKMRPLLITKNRQFSVFIGTNRIHVEQFNTETDSYNDFLSDAKSLLTSILRDNTTFIDRLAVNGRVLFEDTSKMDEIFKNTFKLSNLYGNSSKEFSFRINTVEKCDEIGIATNKIIAFERTNEALPNNVFRPIMFADYDYNTVVQSEIQYNIDDLDKLIKIAIEFKNRIIK